MLMKLLVGSTIAALFLCVFAQGAVRSDILFVLYDAGETLALQPVMECLDNAHVKYAAMVMGTSRELMRGRPHVVDLNKDCGVNAVVDQTTWPRARALSDSDLSKAANCVSPALVVTGMVSKAQEQIAHAIARATVESVGYYDALTPLAAGTVAVEFLPELSELWVPTKPIADRIRQDYPRVLVQVVGQPTLENWAEKEKNLDEPAIRRQLGLNEKQKTILYAGGYGEDYEEAFTLFANAASKLTGYNLLVSLHPKADGSFERRILREQGAEGRVYVIPKSISTLQAAAVSDLVVCQRSTVGMQALFMGRPVIYLDVKNSLYSDPAISNGWAPQFADVESFTAQIYSQLKFKPGEYLKDLYGRSGIPPQSAALMAGLLKDKLTALAHGK